MTMHEPVDSRRYVSWGCAHFDASCRERSSGTCPKSGAVDASAIPTPASGLSVSLVYSWKQLFFSV